MAVNNQIIEYFGISAIGLILLELAAVKNEWLTVDKGGIIFNRKFVPVSLP